MKLAVTGGAGFLGYNLCKRLFREFDEIFVIDIAPIHPGEYPENTRYFNIDVRDFEALNKILAETDMVVHAAAGMPLWEKQDMWSTNVQGTKNVLESARRNRLKRVVFLSSISIYGIPQKYPIEENHPLLSQWSYGKSKIQAEKLCEEYRRQGFCISILRPTTFIGTARLGIFQVLYDWIKSGKRIPMIGNGRNRYQLLEVDDFVDAIYLTLTLPELQVNDTFNMGGERFKTVREDLSVMCAFARTGARPMPTPYWLVAPMLEIYWKMGISPFYRWAYQMAARDVFMSIEKAKRKLGWSPKYSNAEALIRSYQWYVEHLDEIRTEGITHRTAYRQGILAFFKRFL